MVQISLHVISYARALRERLQWEWRNTLGANDGEGSGHVFKGREGARLRRVEREGWRIVRLCR